MSQKPNSFYDKINYEALMYDSDEEQKLKRQDEIDKEQSIILKHVYELYDTYHSLFKFVEITFPISQDIENQLKTAYHLFINKYEELNIEHKYKFCSIKRPFNYTLEEIMKKMPVSQEFHLIYWLMYNASNNK